MLGAAREGRVYRKLLGRPAQPALHRELLGIAVRWQPSPCQSLAEHANEKPTQKAGWGPRSWVHRSLQQLACAGPTPLCSPHNAACPITKRSARPQAHTRHSQAQGTGHAAVSQAPTGGSNFPGYSPALRCTHPPVDPPYTIHLPHRSTGPAWVAPVAPTRRCQAAAAAGRPAAPRQTMKHSNNTSQRGRSRKQPRAPRAACQPQGFPPDRPTLALAGSTHWGRLPKQCMGLSTALVPNWAPC